MINIPLKTWQKRKLRSGLVYEVTGIDPETKQPRLATVRYADGYLETHPVSELEQDDLLVEEKTKEKP